MYTVKPLNLAGLALELLLFTISSRDRDRLIHATFMRNKYLL